MSKNISNILFMILVVIVQVCLMTIFHISKPNPTYRPEDVAYDQIIEGFGKSLEIFRLDVGRYPTT